MSTVRQFSRQDIGWKCQREISSKFRAIPAAEGQTSDQNVFEFSFSSETPFVRWTPQGEVDEILVHDASAVDLSRANDGAPLLVNHDPNQQVGVLINAMVDIAEKKNRTTARFSRNPFPQQIRTDVEDKIRTLVSVGYDILDYKFEPSKNKGERSKLLVTKWKVNEVSIVAVPADENVGFGRSAETISNTNMKRNLIADASEGTPPATPTVAVVSSPPPPPDYTSERARVADILMLGKKWRLNEVQINDAVSTGVSVNDFGTRILKTIEAQAPTAGFVGANKTEIKRYSFARAIAGAAMGKLEGLEKELSDATGKLLGQSPKNERAFFFPMDVAQDREYGLGRGMVRTNTAGSTTGGGFTVQDELSSDYITLLRNNSVAAQAGVRFITGLVGDQGIPANTTGSTTNWGTEVASLGTSDLVWDLKTGTPKRAMARVPWSHQLGVQSLLPYEQVLRSDVTDSLMTAFDLAILSGTGSGGQPTGITATSGIGVISNDSPNGFLLKDVLDAVADVKSANIVNGRFGFVLNALAEAALSGTTVDSGSGQFLMQNGSIRGYPAYVTENLASNYVLFGAFDQAMALMWNSIQILIDPYTLAATSITIINAEMFADVIVRRPAAFSYSANPAI